MSSQNNNNYTTTPTSSNPYISRKLNNMDKVQVMKKEWEDWTKTYHKTLKGLEVMINVQKMMKHIKKIVGEANMMITEMKRSILSASINNWMINTTNISEIQKLYINEEQMKESKGRVEEEEVILIKPYEVSKLISMKSSSFIDEEINNLFKYIKFLKSPTQTRIV